MPTTPPTTVKSIFFGCIDYRLATIDTEFITAHGNAFRPTFAGGGRALLDPIDRPAALHQIMAAYQLSRVTNVYIESHLDCGAYKLAGATFASHADEVAKLYADIDEASAYVREALETAGASPEDITIEPRVIDLFGNLMERAGERA